MKNIRALFAKPIDRRIEEVIKVDQDDESTVHNELSEYIATEAIKDHFATVYKAIADAPSEPHEGIGIWVSGFFGSGKSSFAKILGYTVSNTNLGGTSASQVFKENLGDEKISALLDSINARIPTDAVIFDVTMERGIRTASERITEIMYQTFLRKLDYSDDFDLAELEMRLEADGKLEAFEARFLEDFSKSWRTRRKLGAGISEASRVLHEMDPHTYPYADSWAKAPKRADIDPNKFAARAFELMARRKPGKALIFIIDEVGQYVARSVEKMLDLQAIIQAFGRESKNRVNRKQAPAPCWIVVTSQEKLSEVVEALDNKKIELARLQERFPTTIDLKQSDISEVTGKRVLEKNEEGVSLLEQQYKNNEGRLKTFCTLEESAQMPALTQKQFVSLYPYLPYQIDLCIDIVAGLRLKRGAQRHIGGSNRTIIKQAQQMLVHPRTNLADQPVGTLVTLDSVYELLYLGNLLPIEVTREIDEVPRVLPGNDMALKVVKAIALLEAVAGVPRTSHNLAAVLHPSVEVDSLIEGVKAALSSLEKAQIVRDSEEGYKLQTAQEKSWDTQRNELQPKPAERNRIKRELLGEVFSDAPLKNYRYKGVRVFKIALNVDGEAVDADGQVAMNVITAEDAADSVEQIKGARVASNDRKNELFLVINMTNEMREGIAELYRSREMITVHQQLANANKLSTEQSSSLAEEKRRADRTGRDLRNRFIAALQNGTGFFRGVQRDIAAFGITLPQTIHGFMEYAMPELYPKFDMGARTINGDEPQKFLTAANLKGLPPIFYDGESGLGLVATQSGKTVPNTAAEICREVLEYLKSQHNFGNKVTGKSIETHFQGIGYGWEREIPRLVLAVLLRGGAIEVTYQGRRHRNHNDPACREPFSGQAAFRSASFAPRESLDLKMLTDAVQRYEEITGRDVDIEEGAIAQAFKHAAAEDREMLLPLVARMKALNIPGTDVMVEFMQTVQGVLEMPDDDCIKTLAGEGKAYYANRERASKLQEATSPEKMAILERARQALSSYLPVLMENRVDETLIAKTEKLREDIGSETFYEKSESIRLTTAEVVSEYNKLYAQIQKQREDVYTAALDHIKGTAEWAAISRDPSVPPEARESVIAPLVARAQSGEEGGNETYRPSISEMRSEIDAVSYLQAQAIRRLQELAAPDERIEHVRLSAVVSGRIETREDVEAALGQLREYLLKLLAEDVRIVLE